MEPFRKFQHYLEQAGTTPQRLWVLLLFTLLGGVLVYWWQLLGLTTSRPVFPIDDSYITLQNALILAGQHPEHFLEAGPMSAVTSIGHTLLVSLLVRLLAPETALSIASLLGALACAAAFLGIALRSGHGLISATVIAYVGLASGYMPYHLTNGLETSWAVAAVAWCLFLAMAPARHPIALPALLAMLPFIRPELGLLSVLLGGYWLSVMRANLPVVVRGMAIWIVAGLLWIGLAHALNWPVFPDTVFAKKYYFAEGCAPTTFKTQALRDAIGSWVLPYGLILLGLVLWLRDRLGWILCGFTAIFFAVYYLSFPGALGHYEGRYMAILAPMFLWGWARLLAPAQYPQRQPVMALLVLAVVYVSVFSTPTALAYTRGANNFTSNELMTMAEWVKANIRPDARIMIHDAGVAGYTLTQPMIDLVGLKSASARNLHEHLTWPSCGVRRGEAIASLVAQEKPDYIIILNRWDKIFRISNATARTAALQPVWQRENGYNIYALTYPKQVR